MLFTVNSIADFTLHLWFSLTFDFYINKFILTVNSILLKGKNEGRNPKSEKFQDYGQRPQVNCTFMNSISAHCLERSILLLLCTCIGHHTMRAVQHNHTVPIDLLVANV
jgi:hypothetical protein